MEMSFFYSLCGGFSPFPQAVYSLYAQPDLQPQLQPLLFANSNSQTPSSQLPEKFEPILVLASTTCLTLPPPERKSTPRALPKPCRREVGRGRDENFGWRNQNKDRNVISSILKGYVQFVLQGRGMVKLIEQLSRKRDLENGVSTFYQFMGEAFHTRKSYVGLRYMQEALSSAQHPAEMRYILAVTLRHYLGELYPGSVAQGLKMKKKAKLALLKKARTIAAELFAE
jgi:hypothetical protein